VRRADRQEAKARKQGGGAKKLSTPQSLFCFVKMCGEEKDECVKGKGKRKREKEEERRRE